MHFGGHGFLVGVASSLGCGCGLGMSVAFSLGCGCGFGVGVAPELTSRHLLPAGIEAVATDVGIGLEADGDHVPCAGHAQGIAGGARSAQLGQPGGGQVGTTIYLWGGVK